MTSEQLTLFRQSLVETPAVFRKVTEASRALAEFKGVVATIPNERIILTALALQEAKDSSAIENLVTTHDELFRMAAESGRNVAPAAKEVLRYRQALTKGWELVRANRRITINDIQAVQAELEPSKPGFRKLPGTVLRDQTGHVVYTPPQDALRIVEMMNKLEEGLNAPVTDGLDPLVRMAVLHHRFESIHPFYDGNGRTGRIINVLFLLKEGLLDLPVLYMSRHIVRTKREYYRLLQAVRLEDAWEAWTLYMLDAVAESARDGIKTVQAIRNALHATKQQLRTFSFYSRELLNNLFTHPYTKIQFVVDDLGVSRITATKYLDQLANSGLLQKIKVGRDSYYINVRLLEILTGLA